MSAEDELEICAVKSQVDGRRTNRTTKMCEGGATMIQRRKQACQFQVIL